MIHKKMDTQLERLRDKSIQFTIPLNQTRLSDFLIEEILNCNPEFSENKILFKEIDNKADLTRLRDFLKLNKSRLNKHLLDYCSEELREIASDLKWRASREGLFIMTLEEWVISARRQLIEKGDLKAIFIGWDYFDPASLVISGVIESEEQEANLKKRISQLAPPAIPKYILERPLKG